MNKLINGHGTGWLRDLPDWRDYRPETVYATGKLSRPLPLSAPGAVLPTDVDLRQWCSSIEDQRNLGSCTAQAVVGLVEYSMNRAYGRRVDVSPLFLYKATRNLMGVTGDTGAWLRETLKALAMLGVAPAENWPYDVSKFDVDPSAFIYSLAQNYQALTYLRLDTPGMGLDQRLQRIKTMLYAGFPVALGFTVYDSIYSDDTEKTGEIFFPFEQERVVGGHAVSAVGYSDTKAIRGNMGALLIRNSWGTSWGIGGYGWLPYEYVVRGLADDFWCVLKQEWIDTGRFGP